MARFWKRGTGRSVERLLRANRPTPRGDFAQSLMRRLDAEITPKRRVSPQRYRLALVMAVLLVALAAALGGITAASAGVGNIVHAAAKVVTPAGSSGSQSSTEKNKSRENDKVRDDKGSSADSQYAVGICHIDGKSGHVNLLYLPPPAIRAHLDHGDYYPTGGHC
jgi:hypothetical protein